MEARVRTTRRARSQMGEKGGRGRRKKRAGRELSHIAGWSKDVYLPEGKRGKEKERKEISARFRKGVLTARVVP